RGHPNNTCDFRKGAGCQEPLKIRKFVLMQKIIQNSRFQAIHSDDQKLRSFRTTDFLFETKWKQKAEAKTQDDKKLFDALHSLTCIAGGSPTPFLLLSKLMWLPLGLPFFFKFCPVLIEKTIVLFFFHFREACSPPVMNEDIFR